MTGEKLMKGRSWDSCSFTCPTRCDLTSSFKLPVNGSQSELTLPQATDHFRHRVTDSYSGFCPAPWKSLEQPDSKLVDSVTGTYKPTLETWGGRNVGVKKDWDK